jgi:hypothetical protein
LYLFGERGVVLEGEALDVALLVEGADDCLLQGLGGFSFFSSLLDLAVEADPHLALLRLLDLEGPPVSRGGRRRPC